MFQFPRLKILGKLNIFLPQKKKNQPAKNQKWKTKRPSSPPWDLLHSFGRKSVWSHFWNYIFNVAGRDQPFCPQEPGISEKQLPALLWTTVRAESFLTNSSALIGWAFLCSITSPAPLSWEVKFFPSPCVCIFYLSHGKQKASECIHHEGWVPKGAVMLAVIQDQEQGTSVTLKTTNLLGANELNPWKLN